MKTQLTLVALLMAPAAHAGFLSLVPKFTVDVDRAKKEVRIDWVIRNEGDERSKDIGIDFPQLNESYPLTKDLGPQAEVKHRTVIGFDRLGIQENGDYGLIFRVMYKDTNYYPFSAPYVAKVTLPPSPSRPLSVRFRGLGDDGLVAVSDTTRVPFEVTNLSSSPIEITKVEPSSPLELPVKVGIQPVVDVLPPGGSFEGKLEIERKGALNGSTYFVGMLISGVYKGEGKDSKRFAEPVQIRASVREAKITPRNAIGLLIAALSVGMIIVWLIRRRRG